MDVEEIHDIRQLVSYLRAAEFKAGLLHHDPALSRERRDLAQAIADQIERKLGALAAEATNLHAFTMPSLHSDASSSSRWPSGPAG